jgi:hypothetical protein
VSAAAVPTARSASGGQVVPVRDGEASTEDRTEREGNDMADKQPNIVVFWWDNFASPR